MFRDSHGLNVPPRRGSNPPEMLPLELGIAQQGSRRGSEAPIMFLDGLDSTTTQGQGLAQGPGLAAQGPGQGLEMEGEPLSPTSAQSLMYLLEAQAMAPPASPILANHTSPSPFPLGMGGCNAPVFVPHSMQQVPQSSSRDGNANGMSQSWVTNDISSGTTGNGSFGGNNNGNGVGNGASNGHSTGYHTPPSHRHPSPPTSLGQELSLGDLQKSPSPYQQRSMYQPQPPMRSQLPPRSPQLLPQNHPYGGTGTGNGNGHGSGHGSNQLSAHSMNGTPATRNRSVSLPVPPTSLSPFGNGNSMLDNHTMRRMDQHTQSSLSNHTNYALPISLADTFPPSNHHRMGETFPTYRGGNFPPTSHSRGHSQSPSRGVSPHQGANIDMGAPTRVHSSHNHAHQSSMHDDYLNNQFNYEGPGQGQGRSSPSTHPSSSPNAYYQLADTHRTPYDGPYFQVQFKRCHRCFILHAAAPVNIIKPGDFVIVEGDRGEDMGIVVAMAPRDSPMLASIFTACASTMGRNSPG